MTSRVRFAFITAASLLLAALASEPAVPRPQDPEEPRRTYVPFTVDELQEIVGPIALYPDDLLGHVLVAATLPEEVAAASAAADGTGNEYQDGDEVFESLDPHVQALLPFPDVLDLMREYPDWTEELGDAVAYQDADVLDAVQAFRRKVEDAGNLQSDDHITVRDEGNTIYIEAATPDVVYVPVYQPAQVIVTPSTPDPVLTFAVGVGVGAFVYSGYRWGWGGCHWHSRGIVHYHGGRYHHQGTTAIIIRTAACTPPTGAPPPAELRSAWWREPGGQPPRRWTTGRG